MLGPTLCDQRMEGAAEGSDSRIYAPHQFKQVFKLIRKTWIRFRGSFICIVMRCYKYETECIYASHNKEKCNMRMYGVRMGHPIGYFSFKEYLLHFMCGSHVPLACRCHWKPEGNRVHGRDLTGVMRHLVWVLGSKLGSSGRAVSPLNC